MTLIAPVVGMDDDVIKVHIRSYGRGKMEGRKSNTVNKMWIYMKKEERTTEGIHFKK